MASLILGIGSSSGDRLQHLQEVRQELESVFNTPIEVSPIYEGEPMGPAQNWFLNAICRIETEMDPEEILKKCKEVETEHGRDFDAPRWSDRPMDLDLIAYGKLRHNSPTLQIPHPDYANRLFVLYPMRDLCPDWVDPVNDHSLQELIDRAPLMNIYKTSLAW